MPSKWAMEAARAITAGLDSATYPIRGSQIIEVAERIDAACEGRDRELLDAAKACVGELDKSYDQVYQRYQGGREHIVVRLVNHNLREALAKRKGEA